MTREFESPETVSGTHILEVAKMTLDTHCFEKFSDDQNVWFSYHYVRWLAEVFSSGGLDVDVFTDEIAGVKMPDSIKPLLSFTYKENIHYAGDNKLLIEQDNEFEYTPPVIPNWDELFDNRTSYVDMFEKIESDPSILSEIQLPQIYYNCGVKVTFAHGYMLRDGFGLEFILRPKQIKVLPFGARDATDSVTDYMLSYKDRPRVLTKTAAQLALLTVQESRYSNDTQVHLDRIDQFDRRLAGIEEITPNYIKGFRQPEGLKELLITNLIEKGLLEGPK